MTCDLDGIMPKIHSMRDRAMTALFEASLKDSQQYCLYMTGALKDSGETNSNCSGGRGQLVWSTPYARRRYYEPCTPRTAGTTIMWFETAKSNHLTDWVEAARKATAI